MTDDRKDGLVTEAKPVAWASRVETGPVRIGDDWAGVFIRGDNALHWSMAAASGAAALREKDVVCAAALQSLANTLRSCLEPCDATPLYAEPAALSDTKE